jgi:MoCo/4Fe-4S cofactor protein with predicted Tat translocation signal
MEDKRYWLSLEDLENDPSFGEKQKKEFPADPFAEVFADTGLKSNRRDFLKFFGFSIGSAAALAACTKTPVRYALPYVNKPEEILPSQANYYASTFFDGLEYNSILVKTREGRPIKIEGNKLSPITQGGVSARGQAHVLSLYDNYRLKEPLKDGKPITWKQADDEIMQALDAAPKGSVVLLTSSIISPSTRALIKEFNEKYGGKHITYDSISSSAIIQAHDTAFGVKALPRFRFDKAEVIVSFNADFLGTWLSPTEFTAQYAQNRKVADGLKISRHIQFEGNLSITGSNADLRIPMKPSQEGQCLLKLYNEIASLAGKEQIGGGQDLAANSVASAARELWQAQGKALVVSGSNDYQVQLLVCAINDLLKSYGNTIDLDNYSYLRQGIDTNVQDLIDDLEGGKVDVLLIYDANPSYTLPNADKFSNALQKAKLTVAFTESVDETSSLCKYALPLHHTLEAWGDAEPYKNHFSLQQPTIYNLFDSRQFQDSLLVYIGKGQPYYEYLKSFWQNSVYKLAKDAGSFNEFWVKSLHDGVFNAPVEPKNYNFKAKLDSAKIKPASNGIELQLYTKVGIGSGYLANNPWLQELPDPITRATWDNYVLLPIKKAKELGVKTGDVVKVEAGKFSVELPAFVQPGQQVDTIGIALGYGRTKAGPVATPDTDDPENIKGKNAYPVATFDDGNIRYYAENVKIAKTDKTYPIAVTQIQGTVMQRPIVKETTVANYATYIKKHNEERAVIKHHMVDLYPDRPQTGHKWVMVIDLNLCTGCGACVVACNAENNVPVVGKKEVMRGREMHWLRIDRYYSSASGTSNKELENPAENPQVIFQPMLCQHCNHAPCENVCPVLATVHSSEGLNQQAYNRCFGTRYCANNCPYKVRRFNWFDYANQDTPIVGLVDSERRFKYNPVHNLGALVLNPDVTIRARGVMEKCSFCVQRIQAGKLEAKKAGRPLKDNEDIQVACQQSCPAGAIMFGDFNDPNSQVHKYFNSERSYQVIEEVKTYPSISYLVKVRNRTEKDDKVKIS